MPAIELEQFKKILERYKSKHDEYIKQCEVAKRYYAHQNDILSDSAPANRNKHKEDNPLRAADNRIPHDYHAQLVNQKAAYLFSFPPTFDTGNENLNKLVKEMLGDNYEKYCNVLCVDASNYRNAWIHVWKDSDSNEFKYAPVNPIQIIPIYSSGLIKDLAAVIRIYSEYFDEGETYSSNNYYTVYEYWDNEGCTTFRKKQNAISLNDIATINRFVSTNLDTGESTESNYYQHDFEMVPFIEFPNNNIKDSDLTKIKPFIDVMDNILSGYVNDLDDIQQLIWVLTNYGGTDLDEFRNDLKKYKAINMESIGPDDKSGIQTIAIDIPVEARNKLLEVCRKQIYEQGQGLDPHPDGGYGNSSGEALKFMYAPLELKAGLMEVEFRQGFNKLIRLMAKSSGHSEYFPIIQTWTRNAIKNDKETADICKNSIGVISKKTIIKNHPFVEDPEQEMKQLEEEEQQSFIQEYQRQQQVGDDNGQE